MVKQVRINWEATTGARGGESVFSFTDLATPGLIRPTMQDFITAWAAMASDQWGASLGTEIQRLNPATGQLVSVESMGAFTLPGGIDGEAVADSTCGLVRYSTNSIVNGHRVRGRTYVPGLSLALVVDGQWDSAAVSGLEAMGSVMNGDSRFIVWSRPAYEGTGPDRVLVRPGSEHSVTGSSAWSQCAVLRHRRQR